MKKETKNLMDKLKDFEVSLNENLSCQEKQIEFLTEEGMNCLPERMKLIETKNIICRFYNHFPEIKDYKK